MGELGERLRAAREEKELSIQQIADATRIPVSYVQALEEENLDLFSSSLHARGFLRNYAAFLGLDPDEAISASEVLSSMSRSKKAVGSVPLPTTPARHFSTLGADFLLLLVVGALLALSGFSVYLRQNHVEPMATAGPPLTPTATALPALEGTAYKMDVYLNYPEHKVDVRQRIDYTNITSQTLQNLVLNAHPNDNHKNLDIHDIKIDVDGELVEPDISALAVRIEVELPRPLPPGRHVTLYLDYTLNLPRVEPSSEFVKGTFGYSKQSVSLGNWYPVVAPYRERENKGWYGQTYFPVGDPYVSEVADYEVTITTTQGVVIAGTGAETHDGERWHFVAEQARSFAFAASDQYEVATTQVGGVTVYSYYFPAHQEAGEAALQTAVQAIELFSELYGSYPYADYRVAETEFAGGMEFTGLTFLGSPFYEEYDGTSRTPLIPLTAHEVSHQWFYGLVGSDQVVEPWLDEAPAEYSALLYYERYLPDDVEWWWFYAVDQWAPAGQVDSMLFLFDGGNPREYFDAVYRRGAMFMRDLRETMGDPAFFGFLREYQRRHAYHIARSLDFFTVVREFTTADLVPLQEEYFMQRLPGQP
ncbi:MAG: helix-turn-helix domain-containing protein [Anaerolineae bacterium]|nr:helix-turn-helix domain-containing protein [Anaerolineae bacterium]